MSYTRRSMAQPGQAVQTMAVGSSSLLTQEMIDRQEQRVETHFRSNPAVLAMQSNLQDLYAEMTNKFHQPEISPKYLLNQKRMQNFLRSFITEIHLKHLYGQESAFGVEDFLGTRPPRRDLSHDRVFWKMLASFVVLRMKPDNLTGQHKRSIKTSLTEFGMITREYAKMTGNAVNEDIKLECSAVIEANAVEVEKEKPIATFANLSSFIKNGIFGDQFVQRCVREQVQLAAVHLVVAMCAVRPSEVLRRDLKHAELRWRDVKFFLSLQDDWEMDDNQDSDAATTTTTTTTTTAAMSTSNNAVISKPKLQLQCDLHFRALKGARKRQAKWRDQPLYCHGEEACLDPTLLLAYLGQEDEIFPDGLTIPSILHTTDPAYFDTHNFLPIPIRADKLDLCVFRTFERSISEEGTQTWQVSPNQPWTYCLVWHATNKAARAAGLVGYSPYSLRRLTMNALDRTDIAQGSCNLAVGHGLSSTSMQHSYLSRRTTLDVQGIVMKGRESKPLVVAHGLRQLTAATLRHTSTRGPSTARQNVNAMPVMQQHRQEAEEAAEAYQTAVSSGLQDEERLQALRKRRDFTSHRLGKVRAQVLEKELDALAIEAQDRYELGALLGDGPAAAREALIHDIAQSSPLREASSSSAEPTRPSSEDDISNEEEAQDDEEERHLVELDAAEEDRLRQSEGWQRCSGLWDEISADCDDREGADPAPPMSQQSPMPPQSLMPPQPLMQPQSPPLRPQPPSPPLPPQSPIPPQSPMLSQSPPVSPTHAAPPQNFVTPQQLSHILGVLRAKFDTGLPLPMPDYSILKTYSCNEDLAKIFDALGPANVGTQNAINEALDKETAGHCPWCNESLAKVVRTARVTRTTAVNHFQTCSRQPAQNSYRQATFELLAGKPCPHSECAAQQITMPTAEDEFHKHLFRHRTYARNKLRDLASRKFTVYACPYVRLDGAPCEWTLSASAEGTFQAEDALLHFEREHAIPCLTSDAVQLCTVHNQWQFGLVDVESHSYSDAQAALGHLQSFDFFHFRLCPWCVQDETVSWSIRGLTYSIPTQQTHIVMQHIWPHRQQSTVCPICKDAVPTYDFPEHLFSQHSLTLYGDTITTYRQHTLDNVGQMSDAPGSNRRQEWIDWVLALKAAAADASAKDAATPALSSSAAASTSATVFTEEEIQRVRQGAAQTTAADGKQQGKKRRFGTKTAKLGTTNRTSALRVCEFCQRDTNLPQQHRERTWRTAIRAPHIASLHLFESREVDRTCPVCDEVVHAARFAHHLDSQHDFKLSSKNNEPLAQDLSNLGGPLGGNAEVYRRRAREKYISWIQNGCDPTDTQFAPTGLPTVAFWRKVHAVSGKEVQRPSDVGSKKARKPRKPKGPRKPSKRQRKSQVSSEESAVDAITESSSEEEVSWTAASSRFSDDDDDDDRNMAGPSRLPATSSATSADTTGLRRSCRSTKSPWRSS